MGQNLYLKAGELIVFSEGEYSDYGYRGQYVALQNVSEEQLKEVGDKANEEGYGAVDRFISMCIREGWLADINMREIHLGSYGDLILQ